MTIDKLIEDKIIEMAISGKYYKYEIAKKFHISKEFINNILIERGKVLKYKNSKYVNKHFFDKESKITWYILGIAYPCYIPSTKSNSGIIFRSNHKDLIEIVKDN